MNENYRDTSRRHSSWRLPLALAVLVVAGALPSASASAANSSPARLKITSTLRASLERAYAHKHQGVSSRLRAIKAYRFAGADYALVQARGSARRELLTERAGRGVFVDRGPVSRSICASLPHALLSAPGFKNVCASHSSDPGAGSTPATTTPPGAGDSPGAGTSPGSTTPNTGGGPSTGNNTTGGEGGSLVWVSPGVVCSLLQPCAKVALNDKSFCNSSAGDCNSGLCGVAIGAERFFTQLTNAGQNKLFQIPIPPTSAALEEQLAVAGTLISIGESGQLQELNNSNYYCDGNDQVIVADEAVSGDGAQFSVVFNFDPGSDVPNMTALEYAIDTGISTLDAAGMSTSPSFRWQDGSHSGSIDSDPSGKTVTVSISR